MPIVEAQLPLGQNFFTLLTMAVELLRPLRDRHSGSVAAREKAPREIWVGVLLTLLAATIRFHNLDGQSLWNDEMFTIDVARQSFAAIQPALVSHFHHPPLYFYLVHIVFSILGENIWTLRFLSAICGTLTIGGVYYVATAKLSWKAGLAAGLLCCVSPFHLAYSQEGRPYALAALLALMSCFFFLRLNEKPGRLRLAAYICTTTALFYTHHWAIFLICAEAIGFIVISRKSGIWRKEILLSWLSIGILYLPEIPALIHQSTDSGNSAWWWAARPGGGELLDLIGAFTGTYFKMAASIFELPIIFQIIGAACFIIIFSVYIFRQPDIRDTTLIQIPLIVVLGTVILPFGLSFYKPEVFLWYRYTVIIFPVFCVVIGTASAILQPSRFGFWSLIALMVIGSYGMIQYFSWSKSNIREVASYITEVTKGRQTMLIRPSYVAPLLKYYYSGNAIQLDETYLDTPLGGIVDTAQSFVYVSLDIPNEIRDYMDNHFDKTGEKTFPAEAHMGIVVGVYNQKPEIEP